MVMFNTDAFLKSEALIKAIIEKMPQENKSRDEFICRIFILFIGMRGRYNFLNMGRQGEYTEQTYRNNFEKEFDFLKFNELLIRSSCSDHRINAFDPSYLRKAGKCTPFLGKFWSGCARAALWGLEIGVFASVDIENNTAMSLDAVSTPSPKDLSAKGESLVDHYARIVVQRATVLEGLSKYLSVDAYFAKEKFVKPICKETKIKLICKLRNDADLMYLYTGKYSGRGAPRKFAGKMKVKEIDTERLPLCYEDEDVALYSGEVYSKCLKMKIKIAYAKWKNNKKPKDRFSIFFTTDLSLDGFLIYKYYKARYQIEFLFRDSKGFCGLEECQARGGNKLNFHFNTSLTSVSIAKAAYYLSMPKDQRNTFSMSDIKTEHINKLMLDRFIEDFDIDPNIEKNIRAIEKWLNWGKIAA